MDNEQLKQALLSGCPVIYNDLINGDVSCRCVSSVVYTADNGVIRVSVELLDGNGNSRYRCRPERVRFAKREEEDHGGQDVVYKIGP